MFEYLHWRKGFCLLLALMVLFQGSIGAAPSPVSKTATLKAPAVSTYILRLSDLGHEDDKVVAGGRSESIFWFPMPRVKVAAGSVVQMFVTPSPVVRGNSTLQFYLNDRLVTTLTVDQLRKQPAVDLPIPAEAAGSRLLKVSIRPSLSISDDVCADDLTGNLFYTVRRNSVLALKYEALPHGSVGDFIQGVHPGFVVVLPNDATLEEANAAVWVYGALRRSLNHVPAVVATAGELGSYSGWSRISIETASRGKINTTSANGLKLLSNSELLVYGSDGEQLKLAARQFIEGIRLVAIPALEVQGVGPGAGSEIPSQRQDIIRIETVQASGVAEVRADMEIFTQALPKPPESLAFHLDGTYSVSAGRTPRLDLYFNGRLIESETLSNTGQLAKSFALPAGIGILGRNQLTAALTYPDNGGQCQYKVRPSTLQITGTSYLTGTGSFPVQQLQWQNVDVAFGQPGVVLIGSKLEVDSIRAAAEVIAWMNTRLPASLWAMPELRTMGTPPALDSFGYIVLLGQADEVPAAIRDILPVPLGENSLTMPLNNQKLGFKPSRDSVIGQVTSYGNTPLIALTTFGGLGQLKSAVKYISTPRNFGLLEGNLFVYDDPATMVVFDTRKLPSSSRTSYWGIQLYRYWSQYQIWVLIAAWLGGMFAMAWVYRRQRGRISGITKDGKHSSKS